MLLLIHISIALLSIIVSGLTYARPAKRHFTASYFLVGGTLATGTALVLNSPAHLGTACMSGLVYLALVSAMIGAARYKLAAERTSS
ncbi:MAG TPA: hypothetical protein VJM46_04370 [Candidatus Saccharimonadales bacterium]|nr:hypothetical protein [Candidatus Saccharimonadales bacterium]